MHCFDVFIFKWSYYTIRLLYTIVLTLFHGLGIVTTFLTVIVLSHLLSLSSPVMRVFRFANIISISLVSRCDNSYLSGQVFIKLSIIKVLSYFSGIDTGLIFLLYSYYLGIIIITYYKNHRTIISSSSQFCTKTRSEILNFR